MKCHTKFRLIYSVLAMLTAAVILLFLLVITSAKAEAAPAERRVATAVQALAEACEEVISKDGEKAYCFLPGIYERSMISFADRALKTGYLTGSEGKHLVKQKFDMRMRLLKVLPR